MVVGGTHAKVKLLQHCYKLDAYRVVVAGLVCTPDEEGWDGSQQAQDDQRANDDDGNDAATVDVLAVQAPLAELLGTGGGGVRLRHREQRGAEAASVGGNGSLPHMKPLR